ncbi:uncharacterized protein LOC123523956 isoform X2 [Mercenaria mercenaria]|uniref:uncharacterized protein LOC123523956 isoform X2 n=1 Tax=Mercenaria mercenaria TaxID=6596 RepID=UPI00234EA918|nr:uncharacterized protein LOC123523956 isoform X2 [Mercenaria mercenaria]
MAVTGIYGLPITRSMGRLICLPNIMAQGDTPVLSWTLDLYANISKGCNGGLESGGRISYLDLFSMLTLEPVSSNAVGRSRMQSAKGIQIRL